MAQLPRKFIEPVKDKLVLLLECGHSLETSATLTGISKATLHRWLRRGEADEARGHDTEYSRFVARVREARASVQMKLEQNLLAASKHDWRAAAWLLPKINPGTYGREGTAVLAKQIADALLQRIGDRCSSVTYREVLEAISDTVELPQNALELKAE